MTTGGWINLILSIGFVLGLFGWCLWKLFKTDARDTDGDRGGLAHLRPVEDDEIDRR